MIIHLDKIEAANRINALQLKSSITREHCEALYYDTDLVMFVVIYPADPSSRYSGRILIPPANIHSAQVAPESIPVHQPIGTPAKFDTPSGDRKRNTGKDTSSTIAERQAARKAAREAK